MAGKKGSDELFRLIQSLSVEEKGYFKKFAKRHTAKGNAYLKLFDAIGKQEHFEETSLKKKFAGYNDLKLYLNDMLLDAMVVYHRNNHQHISLLSHIQRIHFLLVKGLHKEAVKTLETAIKESSEMELFTVNKYLQRVLMELNSRTVSKFADLQHVAEQYQKVADENKDMESNLDKLEILGLEWSAKRDDNQASAEQVAEAVDSISGIVPISRRAKIRKTSLMEWLFYLQNDREKSYNITKRQVELVQEFRSGTDSSYYVLTVMNNHILNCIDTHRFEEAERLCDRMIADETKMKLFYQQAFVWGNLRKWMIYINSGQFTKGLAELQKADEEMILLLKPESIAVGLRALGAYYSTKLILLFGNQKYEECWKCLQESHSMLSQSKLFVPDLLMLEMMIQLEFGNFALLPGMAAKAQKKIGPINHRHKLLIRFFKKVSAATVQQQAETTWAEMAKLSEPHTAFLAALQLLLYEYWLKTKFSGKSLEELIRAAL